MPFLTDASWPGLKTIFDSCRRQLQTLPEHHYPEITRILLWPRFIRRFFVAPNDSPLKFSRQGHRRLHSISSRRPILIAEIKVGLMDLSHVS